MIVNISYSKDFKHNYLVIQDDRVLNDDYQIKMIVQNNIEKILPCQDRMVNGDGLLFYDITGKQNLKNVFDFKKLGIEDVRLLFKEMYSAISNLEKYILYSSDLILNPQYIYMNIETRECSFLYYPGSENEDEKVSSDIEELLAYLMERIDNEDIKVVEAVYQIADILQRQHFSLDEALKWFLDEFGSEPLSEEVSFIEDVNINIEEIDLEEEPKREKRKKKSFFSKIKEWLLGEDEEEEFNIVETESSYENYSEKEDDDNTVFIPWIENNENKLYGIGKNNKYHIDLTRVPFSVGKLKGVVEVIINDNSLSRMHAKFTRESNKYFMQDLNSTNGTFKNGIRLDPNQKVAIEPGDEIGLGKLKFIYR